MARDKSRPASCSLERQIEVLDSLDTFVGEQLQLLLPVEKAWQPTDYLPDLTADDWDSRLREFRGPAQELTDELLVVLVGDMITEEALPSYAVALNLIARDDVGTSSRPWARWLRGWTSEENRHGDLLNAYLRLTGRVDMRAVELTVHHLINEGFSPRTNGNPYGGLIYTSFQERATKISHSNVSRLASRQGDAALGRICQRIAGDESRHEAFYSRVMGKVMEVDPEGGMLTMRSMLRRVIAMPGRLMEDGQAPDLFEQFAGVAQRLGVYTVRDYAEIVGHLVKLWDVEHLQVTGKGAMAQDYLCGLSADFQRIAEAAEEKLARRPKAKFAWIFGREA
ncbi:MAG: acyl-ACP desaturase [Planctomycetales bacterium]